MSFSSLTGSRSHCVRLMNQTPHLSLSELTTVKLQRQQYRASTILVISRPLRNWPYLVLMVPSNADVLQRWCFRSVDVQVLPRRGSLVANIRRCRRSGRTGKLWECWVQFCWRSWWRGRRTTFSPWFKLSVPRVSTLPSTLLVSV